MFIYFFVYLFILEPAVIIDNSVEELNGKTKTFSLFGYFSL